MTARDLVLAGCEAALAAAVLPAIEAASRVVGPRRLVAVLRTVGRFAPRRPPEARARLTRAIAAIDRRLPGGERCYRRVLTEIALDGGAAGEALILGLDRGAEVRAGHAWLGERRNRAQPYDVELSL